MIVPAALPVLETPRLRLRPVTAADGAAVYRAIDVSRDQFARWFVWARQSTPASVDESLRRAEEGMACGSSWHYVLVTQAGSLIGRISLDDLGPAGRSGELGYWLRTDFSGRGLMSEAGRALLGYAFGPGGLHRVSAYVDTENRASRRVLLNLGFHRERTVYRAVQHPELGWRDHDAYGLPAPAFLREA